MLGLLSKREAEDVFSAHNTQQSLSPSAHAVCGKAMFLVTSVNSQEMSICGHYS